MPHPTDGDPSLFRTIVPTPATMGTEDAPGLARLAGWVAEADGFHSHPDRTARIGLMGAELDLPLKAGAIALLDEDTDTGTSQFVGAAHGLDIRPEVQARCPETQR